MPNDTQKAKPSPMPGMGGLNERTNRPSKDGDSDKNTIDPDQIIRELRNSPHINLTEKAILSKIDQLESRIEKLERRTVYDPLNPPRF